MICSAYKVIKQGDNTQPWQTPFPVWDQSVFPCPALIVASWPAYQKTGKMVWYSLFFKNFPQFVVIHAVKGFSIVNETEIDVFLKFPWFFYDPTDVGNLSSGSSAFPKSSLYPRSSRFMYYWSLAWRLLSVILLACEVSTVVWTLLGIALWVWNESRPFPILWPLLHFSNLLQYWVQHFNSIIF